MTALDWFERILIALCGITLICDYLCIGWVKKHNRLVEQEIIRMWAEEREQGEPVYQIGQIAELLGIELEDS